MEIFTLGDGEGFEVLEEMLKQRPDELYVAEKFMAVWSPDISKVIMIPGDYRHLNEEQANRVLQEKLERL